VAASIGPVAVLQRKIAVVYGERREGFYHCFSTQEHGDIFSFLMKTQNLTFPEAVERFGRGSRH